VDSNEENLRNVKDSIETLIKKEKFYDEQNFNETDGIKKASILYDLQEFDVFKNTYGYESLHNDR